VNAFPINRHRIWQLLADACLVSAAWWLAFQLRFDNGVPPYYDTLFQRTIWIVVPIKLAVFVLFGFYNRWWRYVSTRDMWGAARGVAVASLLADVVVYLIDPVTQVRLPKSIAVMDILLTLAFVAGTRLLARTLIERPRSGLVAHGKEVLIVGAGDAAQLIIREMQRNRALGYTPIGVIDDDPRKKNLRIHGVRVLGPIDELTHVIRDNRPDEVLIAIPSAPGEVRQRVVDVVRDHNVPVKTLPALHELISGDVNLAGQIREVQVEDVLGREPVEVDLESVASYLAGKTVLVTGAGGSIGAELCRQVARAGAARVVLVEWSEPALFEIERELVDERAFTASVPVLADVKHRGKMRQVFERYRPHVVFHAAAYKHVPLLESNPIESVRNNTLGTKVVADVAVEFGAERFVLVSTDKAVNPKTVMGQSKALCEWIVEVYGRRTDAPTRFVAVRFGNVLNSSGSVVPIFRRQIARGGPVTVTHPEMSRYFMTIPEAVSLVAQAGAIGDSGEVYVLDMGEPVKILDLARNMIRLSGKEPEQDVAIEFIGIRPGEKLHEELWNSGEEVGDTVHPQIMRSAHPALDGAWLEEQLAELERLVEEGDTLELVARLRAIAAAPRRASAGAPLHVVPLQPDVVPGERARPG
jgi:FlaA1/EpsC-like NDP-sugar epimerase